MTSGTPTWPCLLYRGLTVAQTSGGSQYEDSVELSGLGLTSRTVHTFVESLTCPEAVGRVTAGGQAVAEPWAPAHL